MCRCRTSGPKAALTQRPPQPDISRRREAARGHLACTQRAEWAAGPSKTSLCPALELSPGPEAPSAPARVLRPRQAPRFPVGGCGGCLQPSPSPEVPSQGCGRPGHPSPAPSPPPQLTSSQPTGEDPGAPPPAPPSCPSSPARTLLQARPRAGSQCWGLGSSSLVTPKPKTAPWMVLPSSQHLYATPMRLIPLLLGTHSCLRVACLSSLQFPKRAPPCVSSPGSQKPHLPPPKPSSCPPFRARLGGHLLQEGC